MIIRDEKRSSLIEKHKKLSMYMYNKKIQEYRVTFMGLVQVVLSSLERLSHKVAYGLCPSPRNRVNMSATTDSSTVIKAKQREVVT